jgi:hypothetical protein
MSLRGRSCSGGLMGVLLMSLSFPFAGALHVLSLHDQIYRDGPSSLRIRAVQLGQIGIQVDGHMFARLTRKIGMHAEFHFLF